MPPRFTPSLCQCSTDCRNEETKYAAGGSSRRRKPCRQPGAAVGHDSVSGKKIRDKEPYDEAAFEKCLTDSVAEAVRLQAEAVSSRRAPTNSYETYCGDRDSGRRSVMSLAASQGVWSAITLVRPR